MQCPDIVTTQVLDVLWFLLDLRVLCEETRDITYTNAFHCLCGKHVAIASCPYISYRQISTFPCLKLLSQNWQALPKKKFQTHWLAFMKFVFYTAICWLWVILRHISYDIFHAGILLWYQTFWINPSLNVVKTTKNCVRSFVRQTLSV